MNINLKNISKIYGDIQVFNNFNLSLEKNKISCILGISGSGKTTLLNIIGNVISYQGAVENAGDISYIFQNERLINNLTVYQNIEYVLLNIKDKKQRKDMVINMLKAVELYDKKDDYPSRLSGGMKQRLSMARAFAYPSDTLLMDEPFRSQDLSLKKRLIGEFLKLWHNEWRTVVFVTHDIDEALMIADNIYILDGMPAQITHTFNIYAKHNDRIITDKYFSDIRANIYNIMSK